MKCEDCKWYLHHTSDDRKAKELHEFYESKHSAGIKILDCGYCVRFPPRRVVNVSDVGDYRMGWIVVMFDDFCGEFATKLP